MTTDEEIEEKKTKKYTGLDVLNYFKENIGVQKTRKPSYIDVRNYCIALLYYEFKYSENELADIFEVDRTSINYSKDRPYQQVSVNDYVFEKNTEEISKVFPYLFPYNDRSKIETNYNIIVSLDKQTRNRLKAYASLTNRYSNRAAAELIKKALDIIKE